MRKFFSYILILALITIGCDTTAGDKTKGAYIDQKAAKQNLTKGVDYAAQGKFKEAKEEFVKISKVDLLYGSVKRFLQIIEDVISKKIESRTAIHYFKGVAYFKKGQNDKAIAEYNKAIEINPRLAEAYANRGLAYAQGKGQFDQAISDFNKAIGINPRYAMAYNDRAITYYYQGEDDKAWEDVHKAQSLGYQFTPEFLKALREASGRQR